MSMRSIIHWVKALLARLVTCRAELSACEKCSAWAAAVEVLKDLSSKRLELDQVASNAALSALAGRWVLALSLFAELAAMQLVDLVSFNAMMAATPWAQSMALAEQLPAMALEADLLSCAVLCEQLRLGPALLSWQTRLQTQGLKLLEKELGGSIAGDRFSALAVEQLAVRLGGPAVLSA